MILFTLLTAPANTTTYYIAGYVVFFIVMSLYLASLIIRSVKLKQEYELLLELNQEK